MTFDLAFSKFLNKILKKIKFLNKFLKMDDSLKETLIKDLAAIISVDETTSEEMLKKYDWNIQEAIDKYLDFCNNEEDNKEDDVEVVAEKRPKMDENIEQAGQVRIKKLTVADLPNSPSPSGSRVDPEKFSIMSWNLDGLDQKNLKARTKAVINLVREQKHDVIFFQELIKETFEALANSLEEYIPIPGTEDESLKDGYLTATFVRLGRVNFESHEIFPFPNSEMGRTLLTVKASIGRAKFYLLNTHSESTAECAEERVNQMRICFEKISNFPKDHNVIFGGDLNARDKEIQGVVPSNVVDLWIATGSRESAKFTWDLKINTNKQMGGKYQPRCRFDRFFFRASEPTTMRPEFFGITGIDKVPATQVWPSDHFAIMSFFKLMN